MQGLRLFRSLLFQAVLWAILPLLAITAVSVASIYGHQRAERALIADQVARLAHISADAISNSLEDVAVVLHSLAREGAVRLTTLLNTPTPPAGSTWSDTFNRGLVLLGADGQTLARSGAAAEWSRSPQIKELQARAQNLSGSNLAVAQIGLGNDAVTLVAIPVSDQAMLIGAFATADFGVDRLFADMHLSGRASSYLVDEAGAVLAGRQPMVTSDPVGHVPRAAEENSAAFGATFYDEDGETWALGYARVDSAGWRVIVREPWSDAVGPMAQFAVVTPLLVIVAALVSLAAVYLILAYVVRPLRRLGHMADRVALGDFDAVEQPLAGVQEIRDLQSTLRHTVEQIRRYQASMQSYVTAVTQGQEEERKRLARELHDDTAQSLIGLMQRIKLARRELKRDPVRAEERLAELDQLSTAAWEDVRRFSEALRPAYLEQFGLEPALSTLTQQATALPGAPEVTFAVDGRVRRLPAEVELALFRIVQEALNNTRRHAAASRVEVGLRYEDEWVAVTIADNGRGFEAPQFPGALAASGHFGLAGIRERVLLVGGRLVIDSAPGRGARIEVSVPAPDSQENGT